MRRTGRGQRIESGECTDGGTIHTLGHIKVAIIFTGGNLIEIIHRLTIFDVGKECTRDVFIQQNIVGIFILFKHRVIFTQTVDVDLTVSDTLVGHFDLIENGSVTFFVSGLTVGKGQRLGIFAGSGVGKSTLLSMIARNTDADINVIGLIGERGREVLDFINRDLGKEGLKRSVVVVATSDTPSICRLRAAYVCTAIAEYFRDQGKDVMLMLDSVTRFAHAQREIGLANGEPPAQKGYPPSVFDMIPKLLERTGTNDKGTITAFYTVLVDSDDMNEPITDKVRGTLDGHIVLDRKLAQSFHYPAIDVLQSISRLSKRVTGKMTQKACGRIRELMSLYQSNSQMILAGIYEKGNSPQIDEAVDKHQVIEDFLKQEEYEKFSIKNILDLLSELTGIEIPENEYVECPSMALEKDSSTSMIEPFSTGATSSI